MTLWEYILTGLTAERFTRGLLVWLVCVSLVAVALTLLDKKRAGQRRGRRRRIPEKVLLFLGALGGAGAMLLARYAIRHKTKHKRFMIGLPLMIVAPAVLLYWAYRAGWVSLMPTADTLLKNCLIL